jgi:hypothetical protein
MSPGRKHRGYIGGISTSLGSGYDRSLCLCASLCDPDLTCEASVGYDNRIRTPASLLSLNWGTKARELKFLPLLKSSVSQDLACCPPLGLPVPSTARIGEQASGKA